MELVNYTAEYFQKLKDGLDSLDINSLEKIIEALKQAREEDKQIFIFGNGGSSAIASHLVNDLNKLASIGSEKKFRAIALTDNIPLLTAWANDEGYTEIFSRQLDNFLREGDVVVGISSSGNSENMVRALKLAHQRGAITVGLVGFGGGRMKSLADYFLWFPENHYGRVEDAHTVFCHLIANFLRDQLSFTAPA